MCASLFIASFHMAAREWWKVFNGNWCEPGKGMMNSQFSVRNSARQLLLRRAIRKWKSNDWKIAPSRSSRTGTKWIFENDHLGVADGRAGEWQKREAGREYRTREKTKRRVEEGKGVIAERQNGQLKWGKGNRGRRVGRTVRTFLKVQAGRSYR